MVDRWIKIGEKQPTSVKCLESITIDNFKELIKMKAAKTFENVDSFEIIISDASGVEYLAHKMLSDQDIKDSKIGETFNNPFIVKIPDSGR
jgi:hypothetical protein